MADFESHQWYIEEIPEDMGLESGTQSVKIDCPDDDENDRTSTGLLTVATKAAVVATAEQQDMAAQVCFSLRIIREWSHLF